MAGWQIPILRHGEVYTSLDTAQVPAVRPGLDATVSLANAAMVRRDVRRIEGARQALRRHTVAELVDACVAAADVYLNADLPVGDRLQSPQQYVEACSASTGLPHALVRSNMDKIAHMCRQMPSMLRGLALGLDLSALDDGLGDHHGVPVSFVPAARSLAAILPSNSPGVHSLWIPALALKTPVVLKPGSGDPFTPLRVVQALIAAGVPAEAFGYYPATHDVGSALVEAHDRAIVFGGPDLSRTYAGRSDVEVHGPGYAKVVLGPDVIDTWQDHLDLLVDSVARNGGRSCINASTVVVPRHADAIAQALAERLAQHDAQALDHADAGLAAFANADVAEAIDGQIDDELRVPGARDVSAELRGARRVTVDGLTFLRPTVVRAEPDHPLARTEYGFPFVAVVERSPDTTVDWLGASLVVAGVTKDPTLVRALVDAPGIDRLHLGALPTTSIRWDQPHEGNLFTWLWRRRAIAIAP